MRKTLAFIPLMTLVLASCAEKGTLASNAARTQQKPGATSEMTTQEHPKLQRVISKLAAGEQVTIVALGDSNTELTFHTRGQLGFPGLLTAALFQKYGANKVIMINAGHCGESAAGGLARLDRDVLRFAPDLVIICHRSGADALAKIIERIKEANKDTEILLRTPNPAIATNPAQAPGAVPGKELPGSSLAAYAKEVLDLGRRTNCPVVDHYNLWLAADTAYTGPPAANPNKLWMRMSDSIHPGPLGHLIFFREMTPYFDLSPTLPWEE